MEHNLSSEVVLKRRLSSIQELCFDLIIVIVFIVIIGDLKNIHLTDKNFASYVSKV